jgi:hypothetical protein
MVNRVLAKDAKKNLEFQEIPCNVNIHMRRAGASAVDSDYQWASSQPLKEVNHVSAGKTQMAGYENRVL